MLLGLVRPTSGSGTILGGSLTEPATYLHKVGALIESPAFYPQLSGRENLKALARLGGVPLAAVDPVLDRSGLLARAGDKYRSYSLGMKQRLGIAAAMLAGPELLILDEPTNGLDPAGIVEMRGAVENIIVRIVPSVQQWMPGTSLVAVASAGNEGVGYSHGLLLGAVYVLAAIAASMIVFIRSDVTA
jgi:ABC-type Na+ transport system ATPase subunit NatA